MDALINLVSVPMALFVFVWALYRATRRCALAVQAMTLVPRRIEQQLAPVRVTDPRLGRLGCPCGVPCPPIKDQEVKTL